jgi:hypothetical protein
MKLNEIQQQLKVPKTHKNTFANYSYRNAEDILEAVKPLLGDSILTLGDEIVQIGDRFYVKATAAFSEDAQTAIEVTAYAREPLEKKGSDASQITGAASSYARKYALNGLFLIDDTKDADSDESEASKPSQSPQKAATAVSKARTFPFAKDPTIDLAAKKERIMTLLEALHFEQTGKTMAEKRKNVAAAVFDHAGLLLEDDKLDAIGELLAAKVDAQNTPGPGKGENGDYSSMD